MPHYAPPCDTVRQRALSIKYYHAVVRCWGAPRSVGVSRGWPGRAANPRKCKEVVVEILPFPTFPTGHKHMTALSFQPALDSV